MPFSGGGLCAIKCGNSFWIVRGSMNLRARQSFQLQAHRNFFTDFSFAIVVVVSLQKICIFIWRKMLRPTDNSWINNNNNEKRNNNKDDALHAWVTEPTNSWDDVGLGLPPRSTITIRRHNRSQRREPEPKPEPETPGSTGENKRSQAKMAKVTSGVCF